MLCFWSPLSLKSKHQAFFLVYSSSNTLHEQFNQRFSFFPSFLFQLRKIQKFFHPLAHSPQSPPFPNTFCRMYNPTRTLLRVSRNGTTSITLCLEFFSRNVGERRVLKILLKVKGKRRMQQCDDRT